MRRFLMTMTVAVLFAVSGCATTQATTPEPPKAEEKAGCGDCPPGCDHKGEHKAGEKADCPEGGCPDCPDCPGKTEKKGEAPPATPAPAPAPGT